MTTPPAPIKARMSQPDFGWGKATVTITGHVTNRHRRVTVFMHLQNGKFVALELRNLDSAFAFADAIVDAAESIDNRKGTAA